MSLEIAITHGDTRHYTLSDLTDEDGAAIDLALGTLVVTAKVRETDAEAVFVKTPTSGIDYDTEVVNQATLEITPEDLEGVPNAWGLLLCDVRFWYEADGRVITPLDVTLRVSPSIGTAPDDSP